jgi:DNA mismatch endonuclease Vsr
MDRLTPEQRRKTMQAVKSTGSKIETALSDVLRQRGHVFEQNYAAVEGKPDIAFPEIKIAVFCDSDFWHGYNWEERKFDFKSRREFWWKKIERNMERDAEVTQALKEQGWAVLRFWGHELKQQLDDCVMQIEALIETRRQG